MLLMLYFKQRSLWKTRGSSFPFDAMPPKIEAFDSFKFFSIISYNSSFSSSSGYYKRRGRERLSANCGGVL